MTNEEKELYEVAQKNIELMKECKEIIEDINKINNALDKGKKRK